MRTANGTVTWGANNDATLDMSTAGTSYSNPVNVAGTVAVFIDAIVTSAAGLSGNLKLQGAADAADNGPSAGVPTRWVDLDGTTIAVTGNSSNAWNDSTAGYRWVRVAWSRTGGSGTLSCLFNAKGW